MHVFGAGISSDSAEKRGDDLNTYTHAHTYTWYCETIALRRSKYEGGPLEMRSYARSKCFLQPLVPHLKSTGQKARGKSRPKKSRATGYYMGLGKSNIKNLVQHRNDA